MFIRGIFTSIRIFFLTLIFSIPLASILAIIKIKKIPILSWLVNVYISIMRGTPLILQILFFYFIPPMFFGININRFISVIITFSINYAAYFAEIFRSGYISIPRGQAEACQVLALGKCFVFFRIYIPQILKRILPSLSGEVITLVKDTALSSTLGVLELFSVAQKHSNATFSIVPLIYAGIFYFLFNALVTIFFSFAEKKFAKYSI